MRWWSDPEQSLHMLGLVDDSDLVQGVATSVLGYHGLVMGALAPLARQSLVDPGLVAATADQVDLVPVAKALGRATTSLLGAAAERYGTLLTQSTHVRAVEDTTRLIASLANTLPMPLAVDRATAVHGVPISKAGRYAFQMKAPAVLEVVKADLADRALMLWAQDVARREAGTSPGSSYDHAH